MSTPECTCPDPQPAQRTAAGLYACYACGKYVRENPSSQKADSATMRDDELMRRFTDLSRSFKALERLMRERGFSLKPE